MKIVIDNIRFDGEIGCRILKLKYDTCPFEALADKWDSITPLSFAEVSAISNLEERRVAFKAFGNERLIKEVNPTLIHKSVLKKKTTWVNKDGKVETKQFSDVYELYEVNSIYLNPIGTNEYLSIPNCYFVKCKDTSTDREYYIWVNIDNVYRVNFKHWDIKVNKITAEMAIAWTITTNIPEKHIEKIIRQGDCIMIKPKGKFEPLPSPRHLTGAEYKKLLVAES